ncbi:MAG: flagellar motor switch protein FliG [Vampirovibrio sp.]|jgi:flagellar motor switch protein FliG|nr:flagellar motor switch protein FliG [Vampirovibrio sp.]
MTNEALSIRYMTNSQKVAALLIALGPKTASEIMKNIQDEMEVEHIALEIASLQRINPETLNAILAEFYSIFQASGYLASGGVSYARQLLNEAYGENQADKILERLVATLQTNPFDFFNNADPAQLATSFQNENPQLVALVLAYLKPERSAAVLGALSPEMQADVAIRIADMDRTNPEVLREVERIMENKFSSVVTADFSMAGGVESLAEIINRSDRTTEKAILDSLEMKDPEIAEQVRELMFVFEDIIHLDDRSIQRVLREVDTKDLALSLKGSNNDVQEKIFKNMSERACTILKDDMEYMGAVRAKDVQEKQTYIVSIIRALESAGEIVVSRGTEEDDFIE